MKINFKKEKINKTIWFLFGVVCSFFVVVCLVIVNVIYFEYDKNGNCVNDNCMTSDLACVEQIIKEEKTVREADYLEYDCEEGPCYKNLDPYLECTIDKKLRNRINEVVVFWSIISLFPFGIIGGQSFLKLREIILKNSNVEK